MKKFVSTMCKACMKAHQETLAFDSLQAQHVLDYQAGKIDSKRLIEMQASAGADRTQILRRLEETIKPIMDAAVVRGVPTERIKSIETMTTIGAGTDHIAKMNREILISEANA